MNYDSPVSSTMNTQDDSGMNAISYEEFINEFVTMHGQSDAIVTGDAQVITQLMDPPGERDAAERERVDLRMGGEIINQYRGGETIAQRVEGGIMEHNRDVETVDTYRDREIANQHVERDCIENNNNVEFEDQRSRKKSMALNKEREMSQHEEDDIVDQHRDMEIVDQHRNGDSTGDHRNGEIIDDICRTEASSDDDITLSKIKDEDTTEIRDRETDKETLEIKCNRIRMIRDKKTNKIIGRDMLELSFNDSYNTMRGRETRKINYNDSNKETDGDITDEKETDVTDDNRGEASEANVIIKQELEPKSRPDEDRRGDKHDERHTKPKNKLPLVYYYIILLCKCIAISDAVHYISFIICNIILIFFCA